MLCSEFTALERTHHEPRQRSRYDQFLARYLQVASEWLTESTAGLLPAAAPDPHVPSATAATTVLDNWADKSLDEVLGNLRDLLEDPEYPTLKRWREAGGKVLGHFQVYFPEEIAHAAGMLPVKIHGAQIEGTAGRGAVRLLPLLDHQDVARACPQRAGRARPVRHAPHLRRRPQPGCGLGPQLQLSLRDSLPPAERQLLARHRVPARRVRPRSAHHSRRVRRRKSPTAALRHSIAVFNENRRLLRALYDIKRRAAVAAPGRRSLRPDGGRRLHSARGAQRAASSHAPADRGPSDPGAGPAARRLRGRVLRAAAPRPAAHHRPVLLRRGRRPDDRAAMDHQGRRDRR